MVDKLLHAPTVRVKELASSPGGEEYAAALRVLFDLDPRAVEAVTRAEIESPTVTDQEGASEGNPERDRGNRCDWAAAGARWRWRSPATWPG